WPEWDHCRARIRDNRDYGRGFPSADVGRSADGLWERPKPIRARLAIFGPCQCGPGLSLGPLYLLFILVGPEPKCDGIAQALRPGYQPLDSVKNWNDHFFWVDSTAFPLFVSLKSKILSKDPPKLSQYDTEACDFLPTHTAPFRKFSEHFLCWVGISCYNTLDENCYPTFWDEMDFFAFIRHSDPTKVRIWERNLAKREVKLLKMTEGRNVLLDPPATAASGGSGDSIDKLFDDGYDVGQEHPVEKDDDVLEETIALDVSDVAVEKAKKKQKRKVTGDASGSTHPPKKLRDDYQLVLSYIGEKSLAALRGLVPDGSGIPSGVTEPLIAASVALTSDVGPTDSVSRLNLRTCPPNVRYVVSSDDSHHSGSYSEGTSFVRSPVTDAPVVTVAVTTTVVADVAAIPGSKARDASKDLENIRDSTSASGANADAANVSKLNKPSTSLDSFYASQNPYVYHDLTDHLAPPALFAQLRAMDYDELYFEFNVGAAWQVCLGAEVRMRAEHNLEKKGELEDKCTKQTVLLAERDAEIAHLKSLLSLKETEAAKAIRLRGQLTTVEAADAAKDNELKDFKEKKFVLEGERDVMSEKIVTLESANVAKEAELASLSSQVAKLTSDLSGFLLSRDELDSKVAFLESERDCLITQKNSLESAFELFKERMEALQDEQAKILGDRAIDYAINKGIQDGLKVGIDHGQAGRDLSVIEAYDPSAKAKYIDAVNALGAVDFSLLSELESKKDSCIVDLMD
ncbi:hypothetical protein Tco_0313434, partial [Tanacetum coccineum]